MKFNFGTGLMLFFALWATGIIFLVIKCSKENIDLVSKDYYDREIAFQSQIVKQTNVESLSAKCQVVFNKYPQQIRIQYPVDFQSCNLTGTIHFFKPDDAKLDFDVKIQMNDSLKQYIPASEVAKGLWRAQIDWSCNDTNYYTEKIFEVH